MQGNLTFRVASWLLLWKQLAVALLLVLVTVSALGVVFSAYMTRQMYGRLQVISLKSDDLESEYGKLLLEQSAWADYTRIDRVSRTELNMKTPIFEDMVIVKR